MPLYIFIGWVVIVTIAYVALEVRAVRRNWPSTHDWAQDLNNWLLSFKKQPYVKPEYTVTLNYPNGSVVVHKFETSAEMHAFSNGYIVSGEDIKFK